MKARLFGWQILPSTWLADTFSFTSQNKTVFWGCPKPLKLLHCNTYSVHFLVLSSLNYLRSLILFWYARITQPTRDCTAYIAKVFVLHTVLWKHQIFKLACHELVKCYLYVIVLFKSMCFSMLNFSRYVWLSYFQNFIISENIFFRNNLHYQITISGHITTQICTISSM